MRPATRPCLCGCGQLPRFDRSRYVARHHLIPRVRLQWLVDRSGGPNACWLWLGRRSPGGYGVMRYDGRTVMAHRASYEDAVGPIPEGLQLDHLCRVRHCVNPAHLEAVTAQVNTLRGFGMGGINARKTHCPKGHPYFGDNLLRSRGGRVRECRECRRDSSRRWYHAHRAEVARAS